MERRHSPDRLTIALAAALGAAAFVRPGEAQNLLANPGFDGSLAPWTLAGDVAFDEADAAGSRGSGSARMTARDAQLATLTQCVDLPAGTPAILAGAAFQAAATQEPGFFFVAADYRIGANCTVGGLGVHQAFLFVESLGTWSSFEFPFPVPAGAQSVLFNLSASVNGPSGEFAAQVDDIRLEPVAALLLGQARFLVTAEWRTADGASGRGTGVALTGDSGYFWFFDPANVEIIVKVLDGCALNERFWVFAGGLTNVQVKLRVRDTLLGFEKTYDSPQGSAFEPLQDTAALPSCPTP